MFPIILRPIINEKSMSLIKQSFYTFEVDKRATKEQISRVVAKKFDVSVLSVKTVNLPAKKKIQRAKRASFYQPSIKKAIVGIKKGQKIALFEAPEQEKVEVSKAPAGAVKTAEGETIKEKKSLLRGTKVRIEKEGKSPKEETKSEQTPAKRSEKGAK